MASGEGVLGAPPAGGDESSNGAGEGVRKEACGWRAGGGGNEELFEKKKWSEIWKGWRKDLWIEAKN